MNLEFHQLDLRYQALRSVQPRLEKRLLSSLHEHGQQTPIVVSLHDGQHVVVDGYKRVRALQQLHADTVKVLHWELLPSSALIVARLMCASPGDNALEQGWCLSHLKDESGVNESELARRFDRDVSWVHRRLALVKRLPEEIVGLVQQGKVGAFVAQKYLVPLARAHLQHACQLARWIAATRPSTRSVGGVYSIWQNSNAATRQWVVDHPELVERARTEEQRTPPSASVHEAVLKDVGMVAAVSRRAAQQAGQVPWPPVQHRQLMARLSDAQQLLEQLRGVEEVPSA